MTFPSLQSVDALKKTWSDRYIRVRPGLRENLTRFEGKIGRVVTVNYSGSAIVDFADGAWYDITDFESVLEEVTDPVEIKKYDPSVNGAQILPTRQA